MNNDDKTDRGLRRKIIRSLPLIVYLAISLVIGFMAIRDYFFAKIVISDHVIVEVTDEGIRLAQLNRIVVRTWLAGFLLFLCGTVAIFFRRRWMIAVVLLAVQAALAGIIFYYDAEMVKVVGGPIK